MALVIELDRLLENEDKSRKRPPDCLAKAS
jgi:hypothetical protein